MTTAAIDRPLPLRMRPDLVIREMWFGGRRCYVVKDPLALTYAYLTDEEHAVLAMLDARASVAEIVERFAQQFAPRRLSPAALFAFLGQLHKSGLILSETAGQGERLLERQGEKQRFSLLRLAERILALRWRGANPEPILARLDPWVGWLFSRVGMAVWLVVVGWAGVLLVTRIDEIARRLPAASEWLTAESLVWLGIATIGVKTLHELGHALAARRLGCRVHEMGVQLFFFLPCLYTNVSDVWLVPGKWRRIGVSAAGIYVELLLAAIAAIAWYWAEPGVVSSLCLSVVFVASAGTLLLNANPLMRYDGYYVLADLVGVPNLESRSRTQLVAWLAHCVLGTEPETSGGLDDRPRPLLACYAAAALAWRATVLVGVYYAARAMFERWGLAPLADVLLAATVVGMVVPLATAAGQTVRQARRRNELRPVRLGLAAAALAAMVAAVLFVPLPQRITAPVVIEPADAGQVYVTVAGTLVEAAQPEAKVSEGDVVARLESPELRRDLARLESERRAQELHIAQLETTRGDDPAARAAIPAARESLADLDSRLMQVRGLIDKLTLRAPVDGVVLPPPRVPTRASEMQLAGWKGMPLDRENRGAYLETGTLACIVAQSGNVRAVAVVEQSDVPLVHAGSRARVVAGQWPQAPLAGTVEEIARLDADDLPPHLAAAGVLPQTKDEAGRPRSLQTIYQVRIALDAPTATLLPGTTGRARIVAPAETLATRLRRWLGRTFRFGKGV